METQILLSNSFENQYEKSKHSIGISMWHFEWCTKYRYQMFGKEKYKNLILACIRKAASSHEIKIIEVNIQAEHIQVGIDTDFWRKPGLDEYKKIRQSLFGIEDNTFVVLTVADNQERKNLSRSMEIFAGFSKEIPNSKYVLVTREHQMVGWRLRDYAQLLGIGEKLMIFERGMPLKDLWATYAGSDAFLLTSKAEGLNMCILEAMAVGLPVVATKCTALEELVSGRGWMIPHEHENDPENVYRDPFGNGRRYFADKQKGIQLLLDAYYYSLSSTDTMDIACRYAERRDWNVAIDQLDKALKELGPVGG